MRGVHTRKTYKDLERPITTRGGGGALHYCAQVLTDSMCVYTSYIVPHAAAATAGTRPSGLLLHYSEGQQGATGRWHLVGLNHLTLLRQGTSAPAAWRRWSGSWR